jgi:beta-galactosidase
MEVKFTPMRNLSLFLATALLLSPPLLHADKTVFPRDFAPSDSPVTPFEKPARDALCLNGSWQFQPQDLPAGYDEKSGHPPDLTLPSPDRWDPVPIKIPSPWNINSFAPSEGKGPDFRCYPSYPAAWDKAQMGWLRRTFRVPDSWSGKRVILHFDAVAGKAKVFVNGNLAGDHFDLFLPFEFDITDMLKPGADNEILVAVQKASLFDHKGPHGRAPYQVGSMWGLHIAGIWQDVYLEALPPVRVQDVYVQPNVAQDQLRVGFTLKNDSPTPVAVKLTGAVHPWVNLAGSNLLSAPEPKWTLLDETNLTFNGLTISLRPMGSVKIVLNQKVEGHLKLWSPDEPNLYGLILTLDDFGGAPLDVKYTRFGWRQFTFDGKTTLLNGKPIVFKGDAWHFMGIPELTRRYAWSWDRMLKDAGGNTLRLHAQPYPTFFLDVADEMGVMILDESAVYGSNGAVNFDSPDFWQSADDEVHDLVMRDRNHPSIMGWSVCNEIQAFVEGIYHSPPDITATLRKHYGIWADICRTQDPSRPWISADGDFDGLGQLPVNMKHYEGPDWMRLQAKGNIPWGIGEQGGAYYITPEQVAHFNGERAYGSIEGRMEGLAMEAYQALGWMQDSDANYRSIFNMAWYGLQPLPLGHSDTTRPPTPEEGIFFGPYVENKFGVQPERLGPYSTTFNPGYDPHLPLYKPWALFNGVKDAFAHAPAPSRWSIPASTPPPPPPLRPPPVPSIGILSASNGKLALTLAREGVTLTPTLSPALLFIDGEAPPDASARPKMDAVLADGGTVFVWGVTPASLPALNALLPAPLTVTSRIASSLVPVTADPLIAGMKPSDLYFSELEPSTILNGGLDGPLVARGSILLQAAPLDWQLWNHKGEDIKTACILRSQLEAKPSGVALLSVPVGKGHLVVCNLPSRPTIPKSKALIDSLLANLGVSISAKNVSTDVINVDGDLTGALVAGSFPVSSFDEGLAASVIDPSSGPSIHAGAKAPQGRVWTVSQNNGTVFDFKKLKLPGPTDLAVAYLSFWVFSTKQLDNFLAESNLPKLSIAAASDDSAEIWLNGKSIAKNLHRGPIEMNKFQVPSVLLQKGWNHFLVKVIQDTGEWQFKATFQCDQPAYLNSLDSALEKPSTE